jgi:1-deoxy-D-xylulose-5-phosphate synthase
MRFVKPLDEELLHEVFRKFDRIITVEDGTVVGGFGSAILEFQAAHGYNATVRILGIPDTIVEHGTVKELQHECGYDAAAIVAAVRQMTGDAVSVNHLLG